LRVLVASGTWYPDRNGVARVATEVGRRLAERGHEVTALVPRLTDSPAEEHEGSLTVRRVIARGLVPLTVKDVVETTRHSRRLGAFDVLVAHGSTTALGLSRARLQAPLVAVYHASLPRELRFMRARLPWSRDRLISYLNEPIAVALERAALSRCDRVLTLSEYSRSLLLADHPDQRGKIRAVSGGVETKSFCPGDGMRAARARLGLDPSRPLLVTVRRAEPRMGIEQLLRAVRLVPADDLTLAVVGGGLLTSELRRLSSELGIGDRVRFVGRVAEEALPDWYRAADLFVLPTVAYEGFGMVTVEALASGTPVVGTSVGATPELLEPLDPRLVARGSDPEPLAAAIREALAFVDEDFRARCRDYAVVRFDWDEVMSAWDAALSEAAGVREGGRLARRELSS
jgi:glycosyltransferase involved in cell wall biosynthesis